MLYDKFGRVNSFMPKKFKLFGICVIILSIGLSFVLADLFSSIITVGNFAFLTTQTTKCNSYTIYAVSLEKTISLAQAKEKVNDVLQKNGAGFIYSKDNMYYILASGYENKSDAEKVVGHLSDSNVTSEIIEIKVDKIEIDMNLTTNEKTTMSEAINIFKNTYKTLYDISISLDTAVKSKSECKLLLNDLKSNILKTQSNFDTQFNSKLNSKLLSIKLQINELTTTIQNLINNSDNELLSAHIKSAYLEAIKLNQALANDINAN